MKKLVFYRCNHCGNIAIKLVDKNVPLFCCGQMMTQISANTTDGAVEKHMPVVSRVGNVVSVKVGEVPHPMTEEHYISHIVAVTDRGFSVTELKPNESPEANFTLNENESLQGFYAYCNLHGLWGK